MQCNLLSTKAQRASFFFRCKQVSFYRGTLHLNPPVPHLQDCQRFLYDRFHCISLDTGIIHYFKNTICISISDFSAICSAPRASNFVQYFPLAVLVFFLSINLLKPTGDFMYHLVQHPRILRAW